MKNGRDRTAIAAAVALVAALVAAGCLDREPAQTCAQPLEIINYSAMVGCGGSYLDLLIAVDNSSSMAAEQGLLAGSVLSLADLLMDPPPGWTQPSVDNLRVAVVSGDMGLSWGGKPYESGDGLPPGYGDGWPGPLPAGCSSQGDWGRFRTYDSVKTVEIDGETVMCPALATGAWAETTVDGPNPSLGMQAACLTQLGTSGCRLQQPLQAGAFALQRGDQDSFTRDGALLAVLVISDEDDCSIESNDLFQVPEIQDDWQSGIGIACGLPQNQQHLFSPSGYASIFLNASGQQGGAVFAAIAGVPGGEHSPCTGTGEQIDGCLDAEKMRNAPVLGADDRWTFKPACVRREGGIEVDRALPGRRYVEVARELGPQGYVASICEPDWSPAMRDIAAMIASRLEHTCYPRPLEWDPATKTSTCNVVVQFDFNSEEDAACPPAFGAAHAFVEEWQDADDVSHWRVWCALPRIPAELNCRENAFYPGDPGDAFGWYYCENVHDIQAEDFDEVCDDGLDNDDNGAADCEDPGCAVCPVCGGNGVGCGHTCRHEVLLTARAQEEITGKNIAVQCVLRAESDDPNCRDDAAQVFSTISPGGDDKGGETRAAHGRLGKNQQVAFVERRK